MNGDVFTLYRGSTPLLLSLPHVGTHIPDELKPRLVERALAAEDADWHLDRLYGCARDHEAAKRRSPPQYDWQPPAHHDW